MIFSHLAFSQNAGLVESLENLLQIHRTQFELIENKVPLNTTVLNNLANTKDIKLDPYYVRSLIFHSNEEYLKISSLDECKFYAFLENDLLKNTLKDQENVIALVTLEDGKKETTKIPKKDFFQEIYKKKCYTNREFKILFNDSNLQKTVESIKMSVPTNSDQCNEIHKDWINNTYTPYLCKISQTIKQSNLNPKNDFLKSRSTLIKTKINTFQRTYIDNICNNLNSAENFCKNYLKNDIWSKIINSEQPAYKMTYKCSDLINKPLPLTKKDLSACALKFSEKPEICTTLGSKNFPAMFPYLNCNEQSDILIKSKLITPYYDCPGNIDNEAIVNFHRIMMHFNPRLYESNPQTCSSESGYTFAKTVLETGSLKEWPMKICYLNRVENKEACDPYIPGINESENLSEDVVLEKILYKNYGASSKVQCTLVDSNSYNPLRSIYKSGCFIVYNKEFCSMIKCDKKIILDEKEITNIKYIGSPIFDYIPSTFMNERSALSNLVKEVAGVQSRSLTNVTDIKFYLEQVPQSIIHGVGCAEDLLPENFNRTSLNQCQPMPFILDTYIEKESENYFGVRLAIDQLHSPRLVKWAYIYNAVSNYKEIHPLSTWALYGLKK